MSEPPTAKDLEHIDDEDFVDDDDEWATDFDDIEEGQDDFDLGTYAGALR